MGNYPKYHLKSNLEVYKTSGELSMKQVKTLFDVEYSHIKPYKNIKLCHKILKDLVNYYYNSKVSNNK
jgi:hypothetical protein